MDNFKNDFSVFIKLLTSASENSTKAEIKKQYLTLVKKYHPDAAPEHLQKSYNEYMMLLNKVYAQWKAEGQVSIADNSNASVTARASSTPPTPSTAQTWSFAPHFGVFVSKEAKPRTFTDYFEYLLALGNDYYWQAHQILLKDWGLTNQNPEATVYEAVLFLDKARQCYNTILAQSPKRNNQEYRFMVQNEISKLYIMNKNITRGLKK